MKIKQYMPRFILPAVFALFVSASLFAEDGSPLASSQGAAQRSRVVDNAGLLSAAEKDSLEQRMASVAAAYGFDLVIVTEENIGGASSMAYADDFFDYNGYGLEEDRAGCLFLQVTGSREYWFSTSGRGIDILNSAAFSKLEKDALKFLRNDDPFGAYGAFIEDWETFLALDAKGRHYNVFHEWNIVLVAAAWLLSLIIGFAIVQVWKAQMNTAVSQTQAAVYVVPGSLAFTQRSDRFLYSTVTQTRRQTQPPSGGGGIHTGSSGQSHGGGGGRY